MTHQAQILSVVLGLSAERAEALVKAVKSVGSQVAGGRITVRAMMDATHEEPQLLKKLLGVLLVKGDLEARFVPYHLKCDLAIGPDEESEDIILGKAYHGQYSALCPNCHQYLDGPEDVIVRILFSLPRGGIASNE